MLPKYPGAGPRDLSRPLEELRILVDKKLDGQRLDLALASWMASASTSRWLPC